MMAMQQYRIVRLIIFLVIVALTVFLYVSYYANTTMTIPGRMVHSPSALIAGDLDVDVIRVISTNDLNASGTGGGGEAGSTGGRLQQINGDARKSNPPLTGAEDSNSSFAQQYSDVNILSSPSVQPNTSDTKFKHNGKSIEKPQKVSTSNTSSVPPVQPASVNGAQSNDVPPPPSSSAPASGAVKVMDPSRGVRTGDLYESGHTEPNPDLCPDSGEPLRLLILITSAPTHQEARLAIRQTWGHYARRRDVAIGFILGATQTHTVEDSLAAENYLYGDLIRGRFIDSYNNLTLKTISSLEWVDTYCPKVRFILKTDDDMFINVPKLLAFIDKHQKDTKLIYGRLAKKWKPIRNKKSKYYVSPQQYYSPVFPQFTTGPAYLMTSDVVHSLYAKALNQTYLKLEDVFTTGIVAQLVNVKRAHVNEFLNRRIAFNPCNIRKAISVHMVKSNEQFDLWKKLLDTTTKCK